MFKKFPKAARNLENVKFGGEISSKNKTIKKTDLKKYKIFKNEEIKNFKKEQIFENSKDFFVEPKFGPTIEERLNNLEEENNNLKRRINNLEEENQRKKEENKFQKGIMVIGDLIKIFNNYYTLPAIRRIFKKKLMSWNEFKNIYSVEKNTKFKEEKIGSINSEIDVDIKQIIDLVELRNLEAHSSIIEIHDQIIVINKAKKLLENLLKT
jgi:hypothetical protein